LNLGDTYMLFFFQTDSLLDTVGTLNISDAQDGKFLDYTAIGHNAMIQMEFLKVFTAGGVDYFTERNGLPTFLTAEMPLSVKTFPFPAVLAVCEGNNSIVPRYSVLNYDPSLNAIFIPDVSTSNARKPLNPAAYAVPIAVVALVVIGGAVYAFIIRPKMRFSTSKRSLSLR